MINSVIHLFKTEVVHRYSGKNVGNAMYGINIYKPVKMKVEKKNTYKPR